MSKAKSKAVEKPQQRKVILKISTIELLNFFIEFPKSKEVLKSIVNFNFNIDIENKADSERKLLYSIVSVSVTPEKGDTVLSTLKVSYIYDVENFDEVIKIKENKTFEAPGILEIINPVSISTTRGIMYEKYKGTFLHEAILPIINPQSFVAVPIK